ncbi:hypothetical protein GCM10022270_23200 [Terriglobus aquaticus]
MTGLEQDPGPEITDVHHHESHVLIRFETGECVKLTSRQVLDAAHKAAQQPRASDRTLDVALGDRHGTT